MTHHLSRRRFITTSIGVSLASAVPHIHQSTAQPARRRILVDSQVHVWKASTPDRPWPPNVTPQMPEPFGFERLHTMMDEAGVNRVMLVPPSWEGERNDYAAEAVAKYPDRFGVMGRIHLDDPNVRVQIPNWKQQRNMFGIRLAFTPVTAKWLTDVNQLGFDVKNAKLSQVLWQEKVQELFAQVDLPDLLRMIDFEQLTRNVKYVDQGALSLAFNPLQSSEKR